MNLSLRHMRAFMALASLRSFTRAAESCSLTQSAFSALISNLEGDLQVKLFTRNTRHVELTAEGRAFLNLVSHLLPETERALEQMRDYVGCRKTRRCARSSSRALVKGARAGHPGTWDMSAFCSRFRENPRMPQQQESTIVAQSDAANDPVLALIKDATELTPREFELERKAAIEEVKKRSWLGDTAQQITRRVPVSVFAMGDLAAAA